MKKLILNDQFILWLIIINTILTFISGFNLSKQLHYSIEFIDILTSIIFVIEIIIKIFLYKKIYLKSYWNIFDIILVSLSIPSILIFAVNIHTTDLSFLLVFRVLRLIRTFRFFKYIPRVEHLFDGVIRGLKSSIMVLIVFVGYIFIISILSLFLFKDLSPQYYHNPLTSLYTTFKIFTLEGWYTIPETIALKLSDVSTFFVYLYFVFIVLSGGVFGLSIVNSIFVDAMISDNNTELENKVDELSKKIDMLINKS